MTALPRAETLRWLSKAHEELQSRPGSMTGPSGADCQVAYLTDYQGGEYASLIGGFVEQDTHLVPLDVEIAPGAVVQLDEIRFYYADKV